MSPTDILKEVEADLASLAGLPAEIRAKVKAGAAELVRIRDAIDATIAALTGSAQSALTSLEAMAAGGAGLVALESTPTQPATADPPSVGLGPQANSAQAAPAQPDPTPPATASFG